LYIIIDWRIPTEAKKNLSKYGDIIEFKTENIVYNAISGHPDIFITQIGQKFILAPNIPEKYIKLLSDLADIEIGEKKVGPKYPETTYYNCVINNNFLIHKKGFTDPLVLKKTNDKKFINVNQSYTRCSLLEFNNFFITSDMGIYKKLKNISETIFVNPDKIKIPELKHGFFGGTCGVFENKIFFIGSLSFLDNEKHIKEFVESKGYKIIELYNGPLYDGGGIFFIK